MLLVDIGAGTTDITIYRCNRVNPDALPIYAANSIAVAGGNIDFSTIQWFAKQCGVEIKNPSLLSPVLLQEMRRRKEIFPKPNRPLDARIRGRKIALDQQTYIMEIVAPHAKTIFKATSETFSQAYKLAQQASQWPQMEIVLLGGGSRIVGIRQYFENHQLRNFMHQQLSGPHDPNEQGTSHSKDFHLLAVAYGLAYPSAEFPQYRMPNQISPMQKVAQKRKPEYDENALLSN